MTSKELTDAQSKALFKALTIYGAVTCKLDTPYDPKDTASVVEKISELGKWFTSLAADDPQKVAVARLAHGLAMIGDEAFAALMFGFTIDISEDDNDE